MSTMYLSKGEDQQVNVVLACTEDVYAWQAGVTYPNCMTVGNIVSNPLVPDMEFFFKDHTDRKMLLSLSLDFDLPISRLDEGGTFSLFSQKFQRVTGPMGMVVLLTDFSKIFDAKGDRLPLSFGKSMIWIQ